MSSINSYADVVGDWVGLLEAAERNPDVKVSLEPEYQSLGQVLVEVQGAKARQEEMNALRMELTQQIKAAVVRGKEVAIRIRSVARGKIGPKSERLVHFKVAPLRKRPRKTLLVVKERAGETPETGPGKIA
jgi:hypothetical protein